jgi:predicted AlkP superfamily pyrophosphatase or phosphodiesterase
MMKKIPLYLTIIFVALSCASPQQNKNHKLLLISFDGFRHDYIAKTETPNFDAMIANGVESKGLIPIFPSKTFPNHYAIATGLYPEDNGFVGNSMYDPEMDAYFSIGNREAVENADWYEGEPIWNTVEKAGKKAGTMFWVGSEAPIQGMRPTHWKTYDGSVPDSARIDTVIKWLSSGTRTEVDFATLYFSFVDSKGHRFGPDSPEVVAAIQHADDLMGYLDSRLKSSGLKAITNVLTVADHGMAEVSRDRIIVLDDMIDPNDLDIISGSPSLMANVKDGKLDEVYTALKNNEKHFKVYKKAEIPERYHLKNHRRIPELLMVADLGYTINTKAYFESRKNYPSGGAHGFDNQEEEMQALFVAEGPDLKKGYKMPAFENIDLYVLMAHLLDIKPAKTDGNLDDVRIMLNE